MFTQSFKVLYFQDSRDPQTSWKPWKPATPVGPQDAQDLWNLDREYQDPWAQ